MFRILQIALLFSAVTAFNVMQPVSMRQTTVCNLIMTDEEVETILSKATDCMGEECSVDEVDELLVLLKDTQKSLESRMDTVMNMISDLQHLNGQEERQVDEVKALVKDMLRVFAHDVSTMTSLAILSNQNAKHALTPDVSLFKFRYIIEKPRIQPYGILW